MQKTLPSSVRQALSAAIEAVQQHDNTKRELEQRLERLQEGVFEAMRQVDAAKDAARDFAKVLADHYLAEAQGSAIERPPSRRELEDAVEEAELRLQARRDARSTCERLLREAPEQTRLARMSLDEAIAAVVAADGQEAVLAVGRHVSALQRDLAEWGRALIYLQSKHVFAPNPEHGAHHGLPADDDLRRAYSRLFNAPANWDALASVSDASEPWRVAFAADASAPWREAFAALATDPEAPLPSGPTRTVALVGKSPRLVGSAA